MIFLGLLKISFSILEGLYFFLELPFELIQVYFKDIACFIPDYRKKANIAIK